MSDHLALFAMRRTMTTRQLFFSSLAVFFVVLCVAWSHNVASDTVSDGCEEKFYVSKFTNSNVIGLLGHPFGTIVRVTGVSLGEDDPPLKETKGKNRLRIDSVEGMQLKDPIYFYYGTRRDGLALKEIRSPGKDEQFDFYMLETGGFSGRAVIPQHLKGKMYEPYAPTAFRYSSFFYICLDNKAEQ